jgi:hypothetical protein
VAHYESRRTAIVLPWRHPINTSADAAAPGGADAGEYRLLHKYLRNRFADRLVLTFAQMEDLLGFSLPEPAWVQPEWWGCSDSTGQPSKQSDAWTLAGRTATVNLLAQCVTFEREAPAGSRI